MNKDVPEWKSQGSIVVLSGDVLRDDNEEELSEEQRARHQQEKEREYWKEFTDWKSQKRQLQPVFEEDPTHEQVGKGSGELSCAQTLFRIDSTAALPLCPRNAGGFSNRADAACADEAICRRVQPVSHLASTRYREYIGNVVLGMPENRRSTPLNGEVRQLPTLFGVTCADSCRHGEGRVLSRAPGETPLRSPFEGAEARFCVCAAWETDWASWKRL